MPRSASALALSAFLLGSMSGAVALAQGTLLDQGKGLLGTFGSGTSGTGSPTGTKSGGSASIAEMGSGLREALKLGTERVVGQVGRTDGYNADKDIHIPLPPALTRAQSALKMAGMSGLTDDLELRLNRAAEAAAPKAKSIFWDAIQQMTVDDAQRILNGPQDAATQYFRSKMSTPLAKAMEPVVSDSLSEVGAIKSYDAMMGQYRQLPFVPDVKADLTQYVLEKGLDGMFHYLAKEEAAIRTNPAARSTELLRKVFGS